MNSIATILFALLAPSFSHANDTSDIVVEMSAYNSCEPGGDETTYSKLKPSENNLDTKNGVVVLAIPPGSPLKGLCWTAVGGFGDDDPSREFVKKMKNKTFVGADRCPPKKKGTKGGCTNEPGQQRIDVATSCANSASGNALAKSVHLKPVRCKDEVHQAINQPHRQQFTETATSGSQAGR